MDSRLSIELHLNGKKMQVNIACINNEARDEIAAFLSQRNLDVKDILKAYIQKTQEYAELKEELAKITHKIELEIN